MVNTVSLVGRLTSIINEKEVTKITLAVPRSFKNEEGVYETDFVKCILWNGIVNKVKTYCRVGDLIAIKGRIQSKKDKNEIIAEHISFLTTNQEKEKELD